jgi:hypothetical protein
MVVGSSSAFVALIIANYYILHRVMTKSRRVLLASVLALALGPACAAGARSPAAPATLPTRLSDREFWQLLVESSEPNGYFRSDNLTSNELLYQRVIPDLLKRTQPGGVYLGVGPEQNFTYIAAVRPAIAVIFDVRRGNMLVQLMYKALFELSRDRADFVSMLFSRPRPRGIGVGASAAALFSAVGSVRGDEELFTRNLKAIQDHLTRTRGLPLPPADLEGIGFAYRAFYTRGFAVRVQQTYDDLMTATDLQGVARSYLASEDRFTFLKDLESRNLVVPVVGDFAGPKAVRAIGAYLKSRDATVTVFYLSNVEQYLYQDRKWAAFCGNVAALPLDASSTFIRSTSDRGFGRGAGFVSSLGPMIAETRDCGG